MMRMGGSAHQILILFFDTCFSSSPSVSVSDWILWVGQPARQPSHTSAAPPDKTDDLSDVSAAAAHHAADAADAAADAAHHAADA